jgi:hypothetical protein
MLLDTIGKVLWYVMFFTPVITIPIFWKYWRGNKIEKIIAGSVCAVLISVLLFAIVFGLAFRNGLGPS